MKKIILLLLAIAGMVSTASADETELWLVGDFSNWDAVTDDYKMTTTDGNIYTLTLSDVELTKDQSYNFKVRDKKEKDWSGTSFGKDASNNQSFTASTNGTYDLYFVADLSEKKVALILFNKLQVKGAFESWTGTDMTKNSTYSYSYTIDLSEESGDQNFKLYVDAPGRNIDENGWIGNNKVQISETPTPLLVGSENNYLIPSNLVKGYKKFVVTATWGLCTSIEYNWTITVTPTEPRSDISQVLFDNTGNYSGDIYAHCWVSSTTNAAWPGEKIAKINGLYTFFYDATQGYTKIIFNNKADGSTGSQTSDLDLTADRIYNASGVVNVNIAPGAYKMATFSSEYPLDFTGITAVKAWRITEAADGVLTTSQVTGKVPANTGLFITADTEDASVDVPTVASASAIGTNMLVGVTSETQIFQIDGDNTNYILTVNKADGTTAATPKFFKVYDDGDATPNETTDDGNTVPAGKAYLQIPTANAARDFFWFDSETTAVKAVKQEQKFDGKVFNLAGQRIANPTKGLYIVNGKKVIK